MSTNVDSGDNQVDTTASQAEDVSQGSSDQPNSQTEQLDSLVNALLENKGFQDKLSQAAQSQKDRRFDKIEKTQTEQASRLDRALELVQEGKSPAEAKNQVDLEDMLADFREKDTQSTPVASEATDAGAGLDVGTQLKQAGIDPSSEYGVLVASGLDNKLFKNPTQLNQAIMQEQARLAQQPTPSAASAAAKGGSSVPATDATEQYKTDMIAARGRPGEIKAIKAQAIKDGVDVNNIGFRL